MINVPPRPPYAHGQASAHARTSASSQCEGEARTGCEWDATELFGIGRKLERAESRSLYITALGALVHRDVWPISEGRNWDEGGRRKFQTIPKMIIPYFKKIGFWIVSIGAAASGRHKQMQIVFCLFAIIWLNSQLVLDVCQRKLSCCNIQVGPGHASTGW